VLVGLASVISGVFVVSVVGVSLFSVGSFTGSDTTGAAVSTPLKIILFLALYVSSESLTLETSTPSFFKTL